MKENTKIFEELKPQADTAIPLEAEVTKPFNIVTNEDCMEMMSRYEDKFFDLAVIDPPYGTKQIKNNLHGIIDWNESPPSQEYFKELFRVSKNQIIWGENYFNENIKNGGRIVWNKLLTPIYEKTFSQAEIAYTSLFKRVMVFDYQWSGNVQNGVMNTKNEGLDARIHPTQKPIALYDWIFTNFAKAGDKILDTHIGSGSSRIAAHKAKLDFYGCELDENYYKAQEARFKKFVAQLTLW